MAKIEEKLKSITADDIVVIGSIASVISAKMRKIMTTYSDPKEYAKESLKHLKHNQYIVATFISFNLIHMDPKKGWATPDDFKTMIKKIIGRESTIDTTSMLSSAVNETVNDGDVYLDSRVINKALELLKREFKVIHIKKKKEMEDLIGRKVKDLRGRPSFYKPYFNSINLKRIMFDPIKVGLIIKILMNFGLVCFLALVLEADYYVVKKNKDKAYEMAWAYMKVNEQQMKVNWEEFKTTVNTTFNTLDGLDEAKLKIIFKKMANLLTEHRYLHPYILSIALSKNL